MLQPDRLLALNNSIGLLIVAALNPDEPDFENLIREFRLCLNNYDAWAEQFWTGTALDVEQVFTVGNDVRLSAPIKSRQPLSSSVVMCSASGTLTLVHMFDAARFVPIGDTPVTLEPVIADVGGVLTFGEPLHHRPKRHSASDRLRSGPALSHHLFSRCIHRPCACSVCLL